MLLGVVGIAAGQGADGRFHLDLDELLVIVHVEDGLGGIDHLPDDHGSYLDRVAVFVVDLEDFRIEVAYPQADRAARCEGVGPPEAVIADRAGVLTKEDEHLGLVWLDGEKTRHGYDSQREDQDAPDQCRPVLAAADGAGKYPYFPGREDHERQHDD